MAATTSSAKKQTLRASATQLEELIVQLKRDYPQFRFKKTTHAFWSPKTKTIFYSSDDLTSETGASLLHELAHAILGHNDYASDFELLRIEAKAWGATTELGIKYGFKISDDHVQNCLDTYRDWLFKRSLCPTCSSQGLQTDPKTYKCPNCQANWDVGPSLFSRPNRQTNIYKKENRSG